MSCSFQSTHFAHLLISVFLSISFLWCCYMWNAFNIILGLFLAHKNSLFLYIDSVSESCQIHLSLRVSLQESLEVTPQDILHRILCHLWIQINLLIPSKSDSFSLPLLLTYLPWNFRIMLNINGPNRHPCPGPHLRGKPF
jgi:hypothetical protein